MYVERDESARTRAENKKAVEGSGKTRVDEEENAQKAEAKLKGRKRRKDKREEQTPFATCIQTRHNLVARFFT